ncbi:MAG: DUF5671 domain-containing protein [bacterium]|nr:DUF5671 domain-containing protein [bacterium]
MVPQKPGPKEVVLQLFVIVTLYAVAVHVGILLHQLINAWIPDPALDRWQATSEQFRGPMRYALAMLIVFVPIHAWARRTMHRIADASEDVRALRSRRWLGTITIAIAGLILAGDLVAVVRWFLEGDLTLRFSLKALAVLLIAAAVLWYERAELHRADSAPMRQRMRIAGVALVATIAAAVVAGFVVNGSPVSSRRANIDMQRVNDLNSIQWNVVEVWQRTGALPTSLDMLRDDISGYVPPVDPETEQPYEYAVIGERTFSLCAMFAASNSDDKSAAFPQPAGPYEGSYGRVLDGTWAHPAGRHCFERTIDPVRYPPKAVVPIKQ